MNNHEKYLSISILTSAIVKSAVIFLVLYLLFILKDVVLIFFISLVLASGVKPFVDHLQNRGIPRPVAMLFLYAVIFSIAGIIIFSLVPILISQLGDLAKTLPQLNEKIFSSFSVLKRYANEYGAVQVLANALEAVQASMRGLVSGTFATLSDVLWKMIAFLVIVVITFYMAVEENAMKKIITSISPPKYQPYLFGLADRMQEKVGRWLRGQLIVSLAVGSIVYIGMRILGVKYALSIALFSMVLEFVPFFGPYISAVPAVIIAFSSSHILALFTALFFYCVQLVEGNILAPNIMHKAVGISPIISISAFLIGFKLAGIAGAILSVPVSTALLVIFKDFIENRMLEEAD